MTSLPSIYPVISLACYIGGHQVAGVLPGAVPTHSEQRNHKHAGHADISSTEV